VHLGRGFTANCDEATAQHLARALCSDSLAKMEALRLCCDVGQGKQIALLFGFHALRDDERRQANASESQGAALSFCGDSIKQGMRR
jgi:hypothetical protein